MSVDDNALMDNVGVALAELIGKMIRQGYAYSLVSSLYPIALPLVTSQEPHVSISCKIWSQTISQHLMVSPDLTRLVAATLQFLEHKVSGGDVTTGRIRYYAGGLSAMFFGGEPINSTDAMALLDLFWKIGWLENRNSQSTGTTRILAALLVTAGSVQESQSQNIDGTGRISHHSKRYSVLYKLKDMVSPRTGII